MAAPAIEFDLSPDPMEDFIRMPGLLRRWEIQQVVNPAADYRIEPAGETEDGTPVFAVYHRAHARPAATEGLAVTVSFEAGQAPVPGRLLPLTSGAPLMGVLLVSQDPKDEQLLARVREYVQRDPRQSPTASGATRAPAAPAEVQP